MMADMSEFDAILFDAGGVLLLPSPASTGPLLRPFGGSDDDETLRQAHFIAIHALDHASDHTFDHAVDHTPDQAALDDLPAGVLAQWPAYFRAYVRAAGVPAERENAAVLVLAAEFGHHFWRTPMTGAREALATLADRGVPIGIVSNAAGQVEGDLASLGICGVDTPGAARVVCVVDSHLVGVSKPNPEIFRTALEALGLPASPRIAYVGDTVFYDVRASAAAGLTPLLHDPYSVHRASPHPSGPHRLLPDLNSLLDLV
jgi:putative hydrolase of the HAD superfamily